MSMNLNEIKAAVQAGKVVHWSSSDYIVVYSHNEDKFYIKCIHGNHCIGLTWADGVTLNGRADEFYSPSVYSRTN